MKVCLFIDEQKLRYKYGHFDYDCIYIANGGI